MACTSRTLAMALLALSFMIFLGGGRGTAAAAADEKGKGGDKIAGKGKEDDDKGKGKLDPASTHYIMLDRNPATGQERFFCLARGRCRFRTIECPAECPQRKPKKNRKVKGCFADCSSRCETTCKYRKANCNGYGSICYDPRFIGGDGTMFYFHGAAGGDFALVSDGNLHINAHFIGNRPAGRSRDFTWVQALAVMFDSHSLVLAARRVTAWDGNVEALALQWDGAELSLPADADAEWRTWTTEPAREVVVERTAEANSARVAVAGLLEMDVNVVSIGEEENRTHGYGLPAGDAFAHLEMQFRFVGLSKEVEGVLGQTYRPGYVSPVKKGVAMPMMGGEDRYRTPAFMSPRCGSCRFQVGKRMVGEAMGLIDLIDV